MITTRPGYQKHNIQINLNPLKIIDMKNLIIGIILGIAISSAIGATLLTSADDCSSCGTYCDNSKRIALKPKDGGGDAISMANAAQLLEDAEKKLKDGRIIQHARQYYVLSKRAIEDIFNNDNSATGVIIAPYFDNYNNDQGSLNLIVLTAHTNYVNINKGHEGLAYQIKTFCPEICDEMKKD